MKADVSGSGDNPGSFESIDPKAKTGVYTVPIAGSAHYVGGIDNLEVPDGGREISGSVSVALPFGGSVNIKTWFDEDAMKTGDEATSRRAAARSRSSWTAVSSTVRSASPPRPRP